MDPLTLEQMDPLAASLLRPVVERLGYLGDLFGISAHQPAVLAAVMQLAGALRASLPEADFEVLALTVSALTGNLYEQYQHEQLCARRGYDESWIEQCVGLEPGSDGATDALTSSQLLLRQLAQDCVHPSPTGPAGSLEAVQRELGPQTTVAALHTIGYFVHAATVSRALGVTSPVPPYLRSR